MPLVNNSFIIDTITDLNEKINENDIDTNEIDNGDDSNDDNSYYFDTTVSFQQLSRFLLLS
jgi:hypothetical protein